MDITYREQKGCLTVVLSGNLLHIDSQFNKDELFRFARTNQVKKIVVCQQNMEEWDSSLVVILFQLMKIAYNRNISIDITAMPDGLQKLLFLSLTVDRHPIKSKHNKSDFLEKVGTWGINTISSIKRGFLFLGSCFHSLGRFFAGCAVFRSIDFWRILDDCGPKAILIVSLISFMVGLILAFVGAIQLKTFGAQIFVASLVTIGMIRIMGAIMVGIIMAGRTGASYAATIGTMQVNEELDALKTMGIPVTDFLILPRVVALVLTMPLLVLLADFSGMLGGGFVGTLILEIPPEEYWKYAWKAFDLTNFLVGIFHGIVFGFVISLCGCYFGIYCGRNADSVGVATTNAVVWAIVWMIVLTGIITFFCEVFDI
ncbi:MAG: ABC transporter permease [Alphaproteobacteria bacterium]|nr:ABC transporter permease [Alphaproteobacteria bacterium]